MPSTDTRLMSNQPARRTVIGRAIAFAQRRPRSTAGAFVLLTAFACFTSWVAGLRGVIRNGVAEPVVGAWVVYGYMGRVPYPSPCGTRHVGVRRSGGIARTDAAGHFTIPARLHLCCPAMELEILGVFAETLHSALDRDGRGIRAHFWPSDPKVPGHYAHADFAEAEFELELSDCAESPRAWLHSLSAFEALVFDDGDHALSDTDRVAAARMLLGEYRAFLSAHGAAIPDSNDSSGAWSSARGARSYEPLVHQRIAALTTLVK